MLVILADDLLVSARERIVKRVSGRISPFNAPASTRSAAGFPRIAMISVDAVINPITNHFSFFMING